MSYINIYKEEQSFHYTVLINLYIAVDFLKFLILCSFMRRNSIYSSTYLKYTYILCIVCIAIRMIYVQKVAESFRPPQSLVMIRTRLVQRIVVPQKKRADYRAKTFLYCFKDP